MDFDEFKVVEDFQDLMLETVNIIQYQGFNPNYTRKLLQKIEPKENVFKQDLSNLITFFMNRGTKYDKAKQRMSDEGREFTIKLMKKYKVIQGKPAKSDDITLARIGASFPVICARSIQIGVVKPLGEYGDLPPYLAFATGASIIPKGNVELFKLWQKWRKNFSKIINQGRESKDDEMFDQIIWDSNLYNENERNQIIKGLNKL